MIDVIKRAKKDGNSLGGVVEVIVRGVVPGIGSHANLNEKLDSRLGGAMMGIQSVKAVEIGDGLTTFRQKGFESHDALYLERGAIRRKTNYAGGIEGSMSNGEDIIMRLYAKPIPTSLKRLPSFDIRRMKAAQSPFVRSDVCVLPALGVIAEAVASWEIFAAMREKFGGDNISEMKTNYDAYVALLSRRGVR
jgi:chorismate synthase